MSNQEIHQTAEVKITEDISAVEQQGTAEASPILINYEELGVKGGFIQVTPMTGEMAKANGWVKVATSVHVGMLIQALKKDPDYAWSWHCALAMNFYDAGGDHYVAQEASARFISMLTSGEVDITKSKYYIDWMEAYKKGQEEIENRNFEEVQGAGSLVIEDASPSSSEPA